MRSDSHAGGIILICRFGLHRWNGRVTARPGTTAFRCKVCGGVKVMHKGRRPSRFPWYVAAIFVSMFMWYVIVALGLTGHTKVIWGAEKIAIKTKHVAHKIDHGVRRMNDKLNPNQ
jgi:hypothetical protein